MSRIYVNGETRICTGQQLAQWDALVAAGKYATREEAAAAALVAEAVQPERKSRRQKEEG